MRFDHHILCGLFILFAVQITTGQNEVSISLDYAPGYGDYVTQIERIDSQYILLGGGVACEPNKLCGFFSSVNDTGGKNWELYVTPQDSITTFVAGSNDLLIDDTLIIGTYSNKADVSNKNIIIIIANLKGQFIDTLRYFYEGNKSICFGITKSGHHYYIPLIVSSNELQLWKLNDKFEIVNSHSIFDNSGFQDMHLQALDSEKLTFVYADWDSNNNTTLNFHIYDTSFNLLQEYRGKKSGSSTNTPRVETTTDKGYIVTWKEEYDFVRDTFLYPPAVYKFDSLLKLEWEYLFLHRAYKSLSNLKKVGEDLFLGTGAADYFSIEDIFYNGGEGWVFLINGEGEVLWERHIADKRYPSYGFFWDGIKTDDGYSLIGVIDTLKEEPSPYLNDPDSWFVTLDENGCWNGNCNRYILIEGPDSSYSVHPTTATTVPYKPNLQVYPNPAHSEITIQHEVSGKKVLKLYDLSGNLLQTQELIAQKSILNLSGYAAGNYILCLYNDKGRLLNSKKIVVQ